MMWNLQIKKTKYSILLLLFTVGGCHLTKIEKLKGKYNKEMQVYQTSDQSFWTGKFDDEFTLLSKNGLLGFINSKGEVLCWPKYDRIFPFFNNVAVVCKDNKYGLINKKGEALVAPNFDFIADFENTILALFYKTENKKHIEGLLTSDGKQLQLPEKSVLRKIQNQYLVTTATGHSILSPIGKIIYQINYADFKSIKDTHPFLSNPDSWLAYSEQELTQQTKPYNTEMGIAELSAVPTNLPFYFQEGLAVIPKNDNNTLKFGYINDKGIETIAAHYEQAKHFKYGIACVKQNEKWGVIDKNEKIVVPFNYDDLEILNSNYIAFKKNEKYGIIDKDNSEILKPDYLIIKCLFGNVMALLPYQTSTATFLKNFNYQAPSIQVDTWGVINAYTQKQIVPFQYHLIKTTSEKGGVAFKYKLEDISLKDRNFDSLMDNTMGISRPKDFTMYVLQDVFDADKILHSLEATPQLVRKVNDPNAILLKSVEPIREVKEGIFYFESNWLNNRFQLIKDSNIIKDLEVKWKRRNLFVKENKANSKKGVVNVTEDTIIPFEYDELKICNTGIILRKDNLFGFADLAGRILLPLHYQSINERFTGCLDVMLDNKKVLINKEGKLLTN